jgi:hypothetical protein
VRTIRGFSSPKCAAFYRLHMRKFWSVLVFAAALESIALAANPQDVVADTVANAFADVRIAAHLPALSRMGRNAFGDKVCKHDLRMPSGLIDLAQYETSNPSQFPEAARRLAIWKNSEGSRKATRYGVGVCTLAALADGNPRFAVVIALYESPWDSFVRIFWE